MPAVYRICAPTRMYVSTGECGILWKKIRGWGLNIMGKNIAVVHCLYLGSFYCKRKIALNQHSLIFQ